MKKITEINCIMGKAIREGLHRKGITQVELAKKVGSTQRSISSYVTGKTQPPLDILSSICAVLEVDLHQVLMIPEFHYPQRIVKERDELEYMSFLDNMDVKKKKEFIAVVKQIHKLSK